MKKIFFLPIFLITASLTSCNTNNSPNVKIAGSKVKLTIQVGGMMCNNCEETIQKKVAALPGVDSVKATYIDSTAIIFTDTLKSGIKAISQAIESKGYKVKSFKMN
jgi:copper chaperone CopZ